MLKAENLYFRYSKYGAPVLNGASLELKQGEIGILLGKNGSGKTTLFKNILGINAPVSGSIAFDGENLLKMPRRERARRIAYVPQDIHFGALSVFDSILMGRVSYFGLKASHDDYLAVERIVEGGYDRGARLPRGAVEWRAHPFSRRREAERRWRGTGRGRAGRRAGCRTGWRRRRA